MKRTPCQKTPSIFMSGAADLACRMTWCWVDLSAWRKWNHDNWKWTNMFSGRSRRQSQLTDIFKYTQFHNIFSLSERVSCHQMLAGSTSGLHNFEKLFNCDYLTDIAIVIWFSIPEGTSIFRELFSFNEKHGNDYGVTLAQICTKQRCFL